MVDIGEKGSNIVVYDVIKDMHDGAWLQLREIPITVGLHQEPTLSPYFFILVMDEVTKHIRDDAPWCMWFANDNTVLVDETKNVVNDKLEIWWYYAVCVS